MHLKCVLAHWNLCEKYLGILIVPILKISTSVSKWANARGQNKIVMEYTQ